MLPSRTASDAEQPIDSATPTLTIRDVAPMLHRSHRSHRPAIASRRVPGPRPCRIEATSRHQPSVFPRLSRTRGHPGCRRSVCRNRAAQKLNADRARRRRRVGLCGATRADSAIRPRAQTRTCQARQQNAPTSVLSVRTAEWFSQRHVNAPRPLLAAGVRSRPPFPQT